MKKTLISLALACAAMFSAVIPAQAQNAASSANAVYGLGEARSFDYNGWLMVITQGNGTESAFPTNALTIFNAVRALHGSSTVATKFTQVTGTNLYINTSKIYSIHCSNNKTQINWNGYGTQEIEDGCELFGKVKAASINPLNY